MVAHQPFDRWLHCGAGHVHWGAAGAAGLLLGAGASAGTRRYLLIQRSSWVHEGGTWSVPGGARLSGEDAQCAAHREAVEEIGPLPDYRVEQVVVEDCGGGWAFSTVLAATTAEFTPMPNGEVSDVAWVSAREMGALALHPGFARFLERHRLA